MTNGKIKSLVLIACLTVAYANFASAQTTAKAQEKQQQTPEKDFDFLKLVRESFANQMRANWRMSSEYTYKWRATVERGKGKTETWLWEAYFPSRLKRRGGTNSVSVLLAKNGVAAAPDKIEKERREISEKLERADAEPNEKSRSLEDLREKGITLVWLWSNVSVGMHIFLGRCQFDSPSRETVDGRATIKLRFERCDTTGAPESYAYLSNVAGEIWLDETDKMPVRFEAYAKAALETAAAKNPIKSPAVVFVQKKVAEGFWFPSLIEVVGIGNETVFQQLKANRRIELFDYKQSQTEIKEAAISPQ